MSWPGLSRPLSFLKRSSLSFRGERSESPESITANSAMRGATLLDFSEPSWLWIPGSACGRPGMIVGRFVLTRQVEHSVRHEFAALHVAHGDEHAVAGGIDLPRQGRLAPAQDDGLAAHE